MSAADISSDSDTDLPAAPPTTKAKSATPPPAQPQQSTPPAPLASTTLATGAAGHAAAAAVNGGAAVVLATGAAVAAGAAAVNVAEAAAEAGAAAAAAAIEYGLAAVIVAQNAADAAQAAALAAGASVIDSAKMASEAATKAAIRAKATATDVVKAASIAIVVAIDDTTIAAAVVTAMIAEAALKARDAVVAETIRLEAIAAAEAARVAAAAAAAEATWFNWAKKTAVNFPRMIANELAGMSGRFMGLMGLIKVWRTVGEPLFARSFLKPMMMGLMAAAFPASFVTSELLAAVVTFDNLEYAAWAGYLFDKGLGGGYYKRGKDAGKDWARNYFGIGKEYPKDKPRWTFDHFKFTMKSMAVDLCGMANGARYVTGGVALAVVALNVAAFKVLGGLPLLGAIAATAYNTITGLGKFIYAAVGFAVSLVATKEVADLAGDWGNDMGIGVSNLAFDTAIGAANTADWAARESYRAVANSGVGAAGAFVRDTAWGGVVQVGTTMRQAANYTGGTLMSFAGYRNSSTPLVDPGVAASTAPAAGNGAPVVPTTTQAPALKM